MATPEPWILKKYWYFDDDIVLHRYKNSLNKHTPKLEWSVPFFFSKITNVTWPLNAFKDAFFCSQKILRFDVIVAQFST